MWLMLAASREAAVHGAVTVFLSERLMETNGGQ